MNTELEAAAKEYVARLNLVSVGDMESAAKDFIAGAEYQAAQGKGDMPTLVLSEMERYQQVLDGLAQMEERDFDRGVIHHYIGDLHMAMKVITQYKDIFCVGATPVQEQKGMRWVKASDRLPLMDEWNEVHYQVDGIKADGVLMESKNAGIIWFEQAKGYGYNNIEDLSRVEWLCEDESPSTGESEIAFADVISKLKEYSAIIESFEQKETNDRNKNIYCHHIGDINAAIQTLCYYDPYLNSLNKEK